MHTYNIRNYANGNQCINWLAIHSRAYDNGQSSELMIMASHQTFSGQLWWYLTGQTKFDQSNLLYIINGEVNEFIIGKQMSKQILILIISTES